MSAHQGYWKATLPDLDGTHVVIHHDRGNTLTLCGRRAYSIEPGCCTHWRPTCDDCRVLLQEWNAQQWQAGWDRAKEEAL